MKSLNGVSISILALVVTVASGMLANQTLHAQQAQTKSPDLLKDVKVTNLFRADVSGHARERNHNPRVGVPAGVQ